MSLKSKDKRTFKGSVKNCLDGISYVTKNEKNFKREIALGIIALILSYILKIDKIEFIIVLTMICLVLTTEIINTAIERTVDLVTKEYHELARIAKDVSAGSVLVTSIFSLIIGIIIFIPKIIILLGGL
ncbi:MAG: diacylglycerol kinase family protein [Bacilli bacterium]|nr:diacylglycerol kinase family protein [Clostridium sp.]MDY2804813.1 diacylglycerol kinase family protein [Bacilli bacterium]